MQQERVKHQEQEREASVWQSARVVQVQERVKGQELEREASGWQSALVGQAQLQGLQCPAIGRRQLFASCCEHCLDC